MKEHCRTCRYNVTDQAYPNYCDWRGEEIEDEDEETCFDWYALEGEDDE